MSKWIRRRILCGVVTGLACSGQYVQAAPAQDAGPQVATAPAQLPAKCGTVTRPIDPNCVDVLVTANARVHLVETPFKRGDFAQLDANLAEWCMGTGRFLDGSFKSAHYAEALGRVWTMDQSDMQRLSAWRKDRPESLSPLLAEALLWYARALEMHGSAEDHPVAKAAQELFQEYLVRANSILVKSADQMRTCPAWHELHIKVLLDLRRTAQARRAFKTAVARFPLYHPIYFAMARAYEPSRGGTPSQFEEFANFAVSKTAAQEGSGMYARLYGKVDAFSSIPFDPARSPFPRWAALKQGYDDLVARFPMSYLIRSKYAAVACRSGDRALYLRLREAAAPYLISTVFTTVPADVCDSQYGWQRQR